MLALPAPGSEEDKVSVVICGICLSQRRLEPCGRSFHAVYEKPVLEGKRRGRGAAEKSGPPAPGSDDEAEAAADASWRKKRKEGGQKTSLKLSSHLVGVDLYALLEVSEAATSEQIKKQYRKMALQHHPDKQAADAPADAGAGPATNGLSEKEMHFVKIQEAYEVLSDPAKRRQYDSSTDFDDDIPDEVDEAKGFFGTFVPVFRRNARWSSRLPVPELGDEKTDIAKVHKFYDFWFSFESWRDFSMHDEYSLEEAEFREERRWMERQNQKIRKKYQDAERRRILRLAETAERLDPRIRAEREEREAKKKEEKDRRARLKQEEEEAKQREEDEKRLKEEREQAEREEKERVEREQRKQKQQAAKSLRQRAKKRVQGVCSLPADELEELQDMCLALEVDALEALCERLDALPDSDRPAALAAVRGEVADWKRRRAEEMDRQAKQREEARKREGQKATEAKGASQGTPWCAEEMGLLAKGLQRFPGGIGGRWALIAQSLNQCGYPRTEKEVVEKTKELSDGQSLRSMGSQVSAEMSTLKQKEVAKAAPKAAAPAAAAAAPPPEASPAAAAAAPSKASTTEAAAPAAAAAAPGAAADASEWSGEQQKALEAALQKHPATLDKNERWRLIAEDVPGKTKAQCVERFKFLREQLSKKK